MQEYKLTDKDYSQIKDLAERIYKENNIKGHVKDYRNFLSYCYTKAFLQYCDYKNLTVEEGKLYE